VYFAFGFIYLVCVLLFFVGFFLFCVTIVLVLLIWLLHTNHTYSWIYWKWLAIHWIHFYLSKANSDLCENNHLRTDSSLYLLLSHWYI